jgi:hypothetical protein
MERFAIQFYYWELLGLCEYNQTYIKANKHQTGSCIIQTFIFHHKFWKSEPCTVILFKTLPCVTINGNYISTFEITIIFSWIKCITLYSHVRLKQPGLNSGFISWVVIIHSRQSLPQMKTGFVSCSTPTRLSILWLIHSLQKR